jgi:preprotein translocase subunit SecD
MRLADQYLMTHQTSRWSLIRAISIFSFLLTLTGVGSSATCPSMEVTYVVDSSSRSARVFQTESGPVYTNREPLLTLDDFTSANVSLTEGQIVLNVNLTERSGQRIQAFTRKHVGDHLAYVVNGRVVRIPKILDPVTGRGFLIGPFPKSEGQQLADAINGKAHGCKNNA